jgi:2-keto-4-pentenoate hydratase/2-oxohepta-3-ene-1,7-dioic acid hydratase in catechol pathway
MKLASFRADGHDRIGLLVADGIVDLADLLGNAAPVDMIALIRAGQPMLDRIAGSDAAGLRRFSEDEIAFLPPVPQASKIVCLALNNRSLDAIKIKAPTDHPAFFLKPNTALAGHGNAIRLKEKFGFTHPEPELAVVIGAPLTDAGPEDTLAAVFGYSILNDITCVGMREEDSFALRYFRPDPVTGVLVEGVAYTSYPGRYKASDGFAPMGPYLTTADEVPDPHGLRIRCLMDERVVASDHSGNYVWDVANALSQISQTMTLLPGDIVSMGTAVGGDQDDPDAPHIPGVTRVNLNGFAGEVVVEIEGLGRLVNRIATVPEAAA